MQVQEILQDALNKKASDIFIIAGFPVAFKINSQILPQTEERLMPPSTRDLITHIYELAERDPERLLQNGDDDFSFSLQGLGRFRCCTYKQRNSLACVLRVVNFHLPDPAEMHIPDNVMGLHRFQKGLVLVTGSAGSGGSRCSSFRRSSRCRSSLGGGSRCSRSGRKFSQFLIQLADRLGQGIQLLIQLSHPLRHFFKMNCFHTTYF